jgi:preprotein translocase subunit SecG
MLDVLRILLFVVFGLSSLVLIVVILLQEGKGGGLASAFGGAGADTFGVSSGGINKFTTILAAVWIASAIILAASSPTSVVGVGPDDAESATEAPETPGGNETAPAKDDSSKAPAEKSEPK